MIFFYILRFAAICCLKRAMIVEKAHSLALGKPWDFSILNQER